jgi:hypothetical protein
MSAILFSVPPQPAFGHRRRSPFLTNVTTRRNPLTRPTLAGYCFVIGEYGGRGLG